VAGRLPVVVLGRASSRAAVLETLVASMVAVTVTVMRFAAVTIRWMLVPLPLAVSGAETATHVRRQAPEFEQRWRSTVLLRQVRGGRSMTGADENGVK
jgi:hypothetical protein